MHENHPSLRQIEDLKRWFWVTTYSNYFTILSLSGQRNAFAHFLSYIYGTTQSPIYRENLDNSLVTMTWPRSFSLSSVRCKALALFQLNHQRNILSIRPDGHKLIIKKIFSNIDSLPENMSVAFNNIGQSYNIKSLLFLPLISYLDPNMELADRKQLLRSAEKKFVDDLDIIYR